MRKQNGMMLVFLLPYLFAFWVLSLFVLDWSQAAYESTRAQVMADEFVWSGLVIKGRRLEELSQRWRNDIGTFLSYMDADTALVDSKGVATFHVNKVIFNRALPSYSGGPKAVLTVLAKANGYSREALQIEEDQPLKLGVQTKSVWIQDETGQRANIPNVWVARQWDPGRLLGAPTDILVGRVNFLYKPLLHWSQEIKAWTIDRNAVAKLDWDVSLADPYITAHGNGGFPRVWSDSVDQGNLDPFRYPAYRPSMVIDP